MWIYYNFPYYRFDTLFHGILHMCCFLLLHGGRGASPFLQVFLSGSFCWWFSSSPYPLCLWDMLPLLAAFRVSLASLYSCTWDVTQRPWGSRLDCLFQSRGRCCSFEHCCPVFVSAKCWSSYNLKVLGLWLGYCLNYWCVGISCSYTIVSCRFLGNCLSHNKR